MAYPNTNRLPSTRSMVSQGYAPVEHYAQTHPIGHRFAAERAALDRIAHRAQLLGQPRLITTIKSGISHFRRRPFNAPRLIIAKGNQ